MAVIDSQGTTVEFYDADNITTNVVGGVVSFSFGDGSASDIDISTLASTAREYRQGLADNGDFSMELMRDTADAGQAEMEVARVAQSTRKVVLTFPDASTATFNAYVKSISSSGGVDAVITGTATLKITGAITYA